jgi:hypothetical protein
MSSAVSSTSRKRAPPDDDRPDARAEKQGWTQAFGLYDAETDPQIGSFRLGNTVSGPILITEEFLIGIKFKDCCPALPLRKHPVANDTHPVFLMDRFYNRLITAV